MQRLGNFKCNQHRCCQPSCSQQFIRPPTKVAHISVARQIDSHCAPDPDPIKINSTYPQQYDQSEEAIMHTEFDIITEIASQSDQFPTLNTESTSKSKSSSVEIGQSQSRLNDPSKKNIFVVCNKPFNVDGQSMSDSEIAEGLQRSGMSSICDVQGLNVVCGLQYDEEGFVLLSNSSEIDGCLQNNRYGLPRTYWVLVQGIIPPAILEQVKLGVQIGRRRTRRVVVDYLASWHTVPDRTGGDQVMEDGSWLQITTSEHVPRLLHKMFATVGHPILRCVHVGLKSGTHDISGLDIPAGTWRELTTTQELKLMKLVRSYSNYQQKDQSQQHQHTNARHSQYNNKSKVYTGSMDRQRAWRPMPGPRDYAGRQGNRGSEYNGSGWDSEWARGTERAGRGRQQGRQQRQRRQRGDSQSRIIRW